MFENKGLVKIKSSKSHVRILFCSLGLSVRTSVDAVRADLDAVRAYLDAGSAGADLVTQPLP